MGKMVHDLFLLFLHLSQIKNEQTLISAFLDAMNSFPLGITYSHTEHVVPESDFALFLATARYQFGTICLEGQVGQITTDEKVIIHNAVRMLAMVLENHQQARLLEDEKTCLEEAVRERTEVLKESEEKYRQIVEMAHEGVWVIDGDGMTTFVNARMADILGLSVGEMLGRHLLEFMDEEGKTVATKIIERRKEGVAETHELKFVHQNGSDVWTLVSTNSLVGGHGPEAMAMVTDITARKHAQCQLLEYQKRLQSLVTQLSLAEERERRTIATSLHDSSCQVLALIKMKLKTLQSTLADSTEEPLEEICEDIESVVQELRAMTFDLSPPTLYLCGLEAAVEKLLEKELQEKWGIEFELEVLDGYLPLTNEVRVLLYQSMRELVINIVKHAQATCVKVSIKPQNDSIRVAVRDNGVGFNPQQIEQSISSSGGFGLFNIAERLRSIGGAFDVDAELGKGATFVLVAPLKKQDGVGTNGAPQDR
ncbi:MAG: PAS domain S-box protein [Planctomycetes bacterium]|nr:PAS domain S-box protein [Planctomycetota bacterium]